MAPERLMPGGESDAALLAAFETAERAGERILLQGSGLRMSPVAEGYRVVSLRGSAGILRHHPEDLTVEVAAGTSVAELNRFLLSHGQWFPVGVPDGDDDTLGGLVSAGLSGTLSGYGPVRDRVLGLSVATPGFGLVRLGSDVVKSVAGYNMPRLYWGSGGAFGAILALTLKLAPRPPTSFRAVTRPVSPDAWEEWHPAVEQVLDADWPDAWALVRVSGKTLRLVVGASHDVILASMFSRDGAAAPGPLLNGKICAQGRLPKEDMRLSLQRWRDEGREAVVDLRSGSFHLGELMDGRREGASSLDPDARRFNAPLAPLSVSRALYPAFSRFKAAVDPGGVLLPLAERGVS